MYLAPLNYDRFFKKIFGQERFAKAFLQDFLDITIEEIEILQRKNFITDKALPVEFDYRCKLDTGEIIIIEMQQWYKTDVVKRFYLYHSLSASLQLETLKEQIVSIDPETTKVIKDKVYNDLKPTITLIWMVDDTLGFKEDFVTFKMGVEELHEFIKNDELWGKPFKEVLKERERILKIQNNNTKGLDFLSENKLTFIFQKNIVANLKRNQNKKDKYFKWFDFAKKTKNKKNKKSDFKEYTEDKLFIEIMNILLKDRLTEEEIKYITKEDELKEAYLKYTSVLIEKEKKVLEVSQRLENTSKKLETTSKELETASKELETASKELEKTQKEKDEALKREKEVKLNTAKLLLSMNTNIKKISEVTGLSEMEIKKITEGTK